MVRSGSVGGEFSGDRAPVAMDVPGRLVRLRDQVAAQQLPDALLVTNLTNVRYLTGFTGSAGMLFVLPGRTVLMTDGRYETQAGEQTEANSVDVDLAIAPGPDQAAMAQAIVNDSSSTALALEAAHVSWARQRTMAENWFPDLELVPTEGVVETLRLMKDPGELERMARAAQIADDALAATRGLLSDGITEEEFGRSLDFEMRRLGATSPSFETIVAAGPNGAKPHHRPGQRTIRPGEAVVVDFGALYDGYCSDMTRTVWTERLDHPDMRRAVDVVREAQAAGVAAVRPGVACRDVDAACRRVIDAAGWGDRFVHGTGHGVGLDIHEAPSVSRASTDTLCPGHVVTVEPGIYLPGIGGVRIEDTVVVTDGGCRPLTLTVKDDLD